jgi:MFS family permease
MLITVGNANIQGLQQDLGMHGNQYNIALLIFFVPYIIFEIPSNIFIRKLKPSIWLSLIMFISGIATICQGLTSSFGGLVACRLVIGTAEAGYALFLSQLISRFFPGCIYLLSMYYKRWELQQRIV